MRSYGEQIKTEADRWSRLAQDKAVKRSWLQSAVVLERINRRTTGDAKLDWVQWANREYLAKTERQMALSLGCNEGRFERDVVRTGVCQGLEAFDISEPAIARAQHAAERENVAARFAAGDVNILRLAPERYDMVFAVMAMHHFEGLEHILSEINRALKPNGYLLINEYVGASRFQWPDEQLQLATEALHLLSAARRRLRDGTVREAITRPPLEAILSSDPFEAVRSAEIVPLVHRHLDVVARRDYGGSILHLVLHDIVHNFDESLESDRELLEMLCDVEDLLLRLGLLESDFTVLVARKRGETEAKREAMEADPRRGSSSIEGSVVAGGVATDDRAPDGRHDSEEKSYPSVGGATRLGSGGLTALLNERDSALGALADRDTELVQARAEIRHLESALESQAKELQAERDLMKAIERGRLLRALNAMQRLRGRLGL